MLALTRKAGQSIIIGEIIEVTVVEVSGEHVKLAVKAPREVPIHRKEIYEQIQAENRAAASLPVEMNVQELLDLDKKK
ncbi:MAG: carbon storage regulator CsrA [Clostridia bacterium]|jgi:carbon storage regulator|nr:carbon storage regulator CsrA [Clostridia bacterium]